MNQAYLWGLVWVVWICVVGLLAGESNAAESAPVDQDAYKPFKLTVGDLAVEVTPASAFTLTSIWYHDHHIGIRRGTMALSFVPGTTIGSARATRKGDVKKC